MVVFGVIGSITDSVSGHIAQSSVTSPTGALGSSPASTGQRIAISAAPADLTQQSNSLTATVLASLAIKGRAPKTGYTRAQFGRAWTDDNDSPGGHNGCDTRNDILRRDLAAATIKANSQGCAVLAGMLRDPYTATTIAFARGQTTSARIQIDHVVALSNAWQTGAQLLGVRARIALANDPLNLLAVDGPTNEAKGDGDAATWLPPNKAYRCAYVSRQVAVKARYRLWMTRAEHDAVALTLARCPAQTIPVESGPPALARPVGPPTSLRFMLIQKP